MSFCAHCGHAFESSAEAAAKCPACGRERAPAGSARHLPRSVPARKTRAPATSRLRMDVAIAMAVLVLLLALWRLTSRPQVLGPVGSRIVTNVFGLSGLRLAQTAGAGFNSGAPPTEPPGAPAIQTNLTSPNPIGAGPGAELPPVHPVVADDALLNTNLQVKVIVSSPSDATNEPAANSPDAMAMAQRLGDVGAKGGDIQFSLSWDNFNDLDLHCIDPRGVEIWYQNTNSAATGGLLDHDANANNYTLSPVENIYWPVGGAPAGIYQVYVVFYAQHGGPIPTPFTVRTVVRGLTNYFANSIALDSDNRTKKWICTIQYDPTNPDPAKRRRFLNPPQSQ